MKRNRMWLIAIVILLSVFGTASFAESQTIDIELYEEYLNCVFMIQWEQKDAPAEVAVISPDGAVFSALSTPGRVSAQAGQVLINVGQAQAGTWLVEITGEHLGEVDISGGELPGNMTVEQLEVVQNGSSCILNWVVANAPERLTVDIYADTDSSGYDGDWLLTSYGSPSDSVKASTNSLDTGYYHLYIKVSDSTGIFEYAYAPTVIWHDNSRGADPIDDVSAVLLNEDIYISWADANARGYRVVVYDGESYDLLEEIETEDNSVVLAMPEGRDQVVVGVAKVSYGRRGRFEPITVTATGGPVGTISFPEGEATNQTPLLAEVELSENETVFALVNDVIRLEGQTDSGTYAVPLVEGDNEIIFVIEDARGNMATFEKAVYFDSTPPHLALDTDVDQKTIDSEHLYLTGYVEAGASLSFNGNPVELSGSYFSIRCDLSRGENQIQLIAEDLAGNETRITAQVNRQWVTRDDVELAAVAGIGILLLSLYAVNFRRVKKRRQTDEEE